MSLETSLDRRDLLAAVAATGGVALLASAQPAYIGGSPTKPSPQPLPGFDASKGEYVLPPLPYEAAALEPHLDASTIELHHGKHHKAYVEGLNKALKALREIREGGDASLVKHWSRELSFHGSGHVNHTLYWNMMAPAGKGGGGVPSGPLAEAIDRDFGSFDRFVSHFKAAAMQVEGGGWAWLVVCPLSRRLLILQQEKQQDLMLTGARPVLGVDVWEHAYYLNHQNRRSDYVTAFMNVVNWKFCESLFAAAV